MKEIKKILVTGKDGQIGWELRRALAPLGHVIALDREGLDLTNLKEIRRVITDMRPKLIVNAAAYTAVDKAESDREMAKLINADAPTILAEEAKKIGSLFVHYSTDYIFDGMSSSPYIESDAASPQNIYGVTKLEGEKGIMSCEGKHLILRTSWVYGSRGRNFLLTMLKLAKERDSLKIVGDQYGVPTWSRMIALATANMVVAILSKDSEESDLLGTYHLTSAGSTSWYEFAKAILEGYKARHPEFTIPEVSKILTADFPLPAKRPMHSVLSCDKLKERLGLIMPHWKDALDLCMDEM